MDRLEPGSDPLELGAVVGLAGMVDPVGQPHRDRLRAQLDAEVDHVSVVVDGDLADRRVGVGQAAELVRQGAAGGGGRVVLEGVRVHGVEADRPLRGVLTQGGGIGRVVPGHVERDRPVAPGERIEGGHVVDLLLGGARLAAAGEPAEPGATGADGPRGRRHRELRQGLDDRLGGHRPAAVEALGEMPDVALESVGSVLVQVFDAVPVDHGRPSLSVTVSSQERRRHAAVHRDDEPVVWPRAPATRAMAASATCSGKTSRFSRVRSA